MTIEDILVEAGVARATFYAHFRDKDDVTRAVVDDMYARAEALYRSLAEIETMDRRVLVKWLLESYEQWQTYQEEVSALLKGYSKLFYRSRLEEFAEIFVGDGRWFACSRPTAILRARLLIIQLERAMLDTASGEWPSSPQCLVEELASLWLEAFARPEVAS